MIEPTRADIGRSVIHRNIRQQLVERGVVIAYNPDVVFVRYADGREARMVRRDELEWMPPAQPMPGAP